MLKRLRFLFLLASLPLFSAAANTLEPQPNGRRITRLLARAMPQVHMSHEPLSESLARRTLENFFRALDFDRTIFKQEDIMQLRKEAADLERNLMEGEVEFAYRAFDLFKQRAANRVEFVKNLLEQGFDVDLDEEYVWRRKDAAWAETDEAWDDLWRKKVKNEYVGILVSREMREIEAEEEKAEAAEDAKTENAEDGSAADGTEGGAPVEEVAEEVAEEAAEEALEEAVAEVDLTPEERIRKRYTQFLEVLSGHDSQYVLQMFLDSFAGAYDAHSSYMSPRREEDFDIQMKLSLTGIGAILTYDEGAAKIERLMKGGPAARDGRLQPGDKIIAVEQEGEEPKDILYWPLYKSVRLIRGPIGSTVILHVIPASDATGTQVRLIDIVRDEIKLEEKAAHAKVHEVMRDESAYKLGIISLPDFYADFSGKQDDPDTARSSAADVRRLLEDLNQQEVDGLVLDLRNNGGGSLSDCVEMTGYFIDKGPVVQVKSGRRVRTMDDPDDGVLFDKPMVVLVNRLSASASEILAAALQDYGRAVIVGDSKTHGKGSVQSLLPLDRGDSDMGALKVTTAGFFRVDGRSTQLKGVSPDIIIRTPTDVMELGEEYLQNVLPWSWVNPAPFRPFQDPRSMRDMNQVLDEKSTARLQENEKFSYYQTKVDRLAERVRRRKVSLKLEDRLEQTKKDRELDKLQDKGLVIADQALEPEGGEDVGDEEEAAEIRPDKDMILREGLEILADFLEFRSAGPAAENPRPGVGAMMAPAP